MMDHRRDEYVSSMLGIPTEVLAAHPYRIDENVPDAGEGYQWRIVWLGVPPRGVAAPSVGIAPFDYAHLEDADV